MSLSETTSVSSARSRPGVLARLAATVGFHLFLVAGSVVLGTAAILTGWIPPRGNWMYRCARLWSRGLLFMSGVRLQTEGLEELERQLDGRPAVFMANHQSLFDIPVLIATVPGQTRFLAKRSLFRIPFFGWSLWVGGFVPVDREDRSRARETFRIAASRVAQGASLVVFPEETRSRDGRLLPFKSGGLLLALKTGAPIVPVGIEGTWRIRQRDSRGVTPGVARVRYGTPLDAESLGVRRKRELLDTVRGKISELARSDA